MALFYSCAGGSARTGTANTYILICAYVIGLARIYQVHVCSLYDEIFMFTSHVLLYVSFDVMYYSFFFLFIFAFNSCY